MATPAAMARSTAERPITSGSLYQVGSMGLALFGFQGRPVRGAPDADLPCFGAGLSYQRCKHRERAEGEGRRDHDDRREAIGFTYGMIRISAGIEDIDDLTVDLRQALD